MYTEFQNSLIMQIYANVFKITQNASSSFVLSDRANWGLSGASNFDFLTSRKYHMKFAIFDVARCRMSATSLTFWFISQKVFYRF